MITTSNIKSLFDTLISDEALCRFMYYGDDPLSEDKPNIVGSANHREMMQDIIRFSPQINDLENEERSRVCLYKGYTKLRTINSSVRQESIQIDLYVPHRLVREDFRIYELENKIVSILDGITIGVGTLDYSEGYFIPSPSISGYSYYRMIFVMEEGRPKFGKH
jgi:hypothetical protein